ncbi:MAG: lipid IV(A) palmitoyltransferase PagP [Rhodocyclaceae bacterium]
MPRHSLRRLCAAVCGALCVASASAEPAMPSDDISFFDRATQRLATTWNEGRSELYLPLHTYHFRHAYSREKIDSFNENSFGLGIGRGAYASNGDWHGLYVMGFRDSHDEPQYLAGYGYKTYWQIDGELKAGLGYTAFLTARSDIARYTPIPGILPIASLEYRKVSLDTAYVPGGRGVGNILFFWGKLRF